MYFSAAVVSLSLYFYFDGFGAGELLKLAEAGSKDHRVLLSGWILVVRPRNGL